MATLPLSVVHGIAGIKLYRRNFVVNFVRYYSFVKFWKIIKVYICTLHFSDARMHT